MMLIRATLSAIFGAASAIAWMLLNLYGAYLVIGTHRTMTDGDIIPIAVWAVLAFAGGIKIMQFWDRLFGVRDQTFDQYWRTLFK